MVARAPAALSKLVARMLAQHPASRPASGGEAHTALIAIQRSLEPRRLARTAWAVALGAAAVAAYVLLRPPGTLERPGRLLVALADTANAAGDPDLDAVSELLRVGLGQSKRVSLVARSQLAAALGRPGPGAPTMVDDGSLREAAGKLEAQALIIPAVRRAGTGFDLELRAVQPERGTPLFTLRERAGGKGSVRDALDRLVDRTRAELRERPGDSPRSAVRLARAFPANPEAWRHYFEGQRLLDEFRLGAGLAAFQRALAVEPDFPLVHARLAASLAYFDADASQRHFDVAMAHLDQVPPLDRLLLEASRASAEGRMADALVRWDQAIAEAPQALEPYLRAGTTLHEGLSESAAARPYLEKALEIGGIPPHRRTDVLVELGRLDDALAHTRRWADEAPGSLSFANLSAVLKLRGEIGPALEAARRAAEFDFLPTASGEAFWTFVEAGAVEELERLYAARGERSPVLLALRGRVRAAIAETDARFRRELARERASGQWTPGSEVGEAAMYHGLRGSLAYALGKPDLLWREVEAQLGLGSSAASCAASALADLGDVARASRLVGLFAATDPRMYCTRLFRLVRDWKRGDAEGAVRGLAAMHGADPAFYLGVALGELGRNREAVAAFRLYRRRPAWNGSPEVLYPRSLYHEAAALEWLGEPDQAREVLRRLLHIWERADPDLPLLRDARALQKRLGAANGRK